MLRTGTTAQVKTELRKLHIRWWHAGRTQMEKVLTAAKVAPAVISAAPGIIDTCRECRAWKAPAPDVTPSVEMAVRQNEFVEADIMFYKQFMVFHMIDRADRFHATRVIESKTATALCKAIDLTWITIFGNFEYLVIDGEKAWTAKRPQSA